MVSFYANCRIALALVQGAYPKMVAIPTQLPQSYLEMANQPGLPNIMTNMTMSLYSTATKPDLSVNIR